MVRLLERIDQVYNRLTVLHQKVVAIWNELLHVRPGYRELDVRFGETFDMFGHVPGNHRVHQLGHTRDNRRLDHVARVSTDTGLTTIRENGGFYA